MRNRRILFFIGFISCLSLCSQIPVAPSIQSASPEICVSKTNLQNYVDFLAADDLEGRLIGSRGLKVARLYAASLYKMWGVEPAVPEATGKTYFQPIPVSEIREEKGSALFQVEGPASRQTWNFQEDADFDLEMFSLMPREISGPVVFAGFGLEEKEWNDLEGINIRGKFVMILTGAPDIKPLAEESMNVQKRIRNIAEHGALGVLLADPSDESFARSYKAKFGSPYVQGKIIKREIKAFASAELETTRPASCYFVMTPSRGMVDTILKAAGLGLDVLQAKMAKEKKPCPIALENITLTLRKELKYLPFLDANVLGMIQGTDPELKKDIIIVGSHLDHVEFYNNYVWNGANDNASGCAIVLELARALAVQGARPKRTILFALWTGEEKGQIGSRFFIRHPPVSLSQVKLLINLDCLGREVSEDAFHRHPTLFGADKTTWEEARKMELVWIPRKFPQLKKLTEEKCRIAGLPHALKFVERIALESDHNSFFFLGIPVLYMNNGDFEDIHTPADTADKLDYDKLWRAAGTLELLLRDILTMPQLNL